MGGPRPSIISQPEALTPAPASELLGDRDPLERGGVRAEPELRPGRRLVAQRVQRQLPLHRRRTRPGRASSAARRRPRGSRSAARARCSPGSTAASRSPRARAPAARPRGRAGSPAGVVPSRRASASSPIPSVVPRAASTDPVSTSSWRAWPSSCATIDEDLVARQVVDDVVVEDDPAGAAVARDVGVERRRTT